jgi:hypothetical protein
LKRLPENISVQFSHQIQSSHEREKSWGTAHALLSARPLIKGPFAVLNADDFYGQGAFEKAAAFMRGDTTVANTAGLLGYRLKNTIHNDNAVSRALCRTDDAGELTSLQELTVSRRGNGGDNYAGTAAGSDSLSIELSGEECISMNF